MVGLDYGIQNLLPVPEFTINSELYKPKLYMDRDYLYEKHVVEGLNMAQIATLLFTCKGTVRNHLIRHNIPLNNPETNKKMHKETKFGYHKRHDKVVEKKVEQKVIRAIIEMRNSKMSLRAIAKTLDSLKISTKKKGGKWHPEMVRKILKNQE